MDEERIEFHEETRNDIEEFRLITLKNDAEISEVVATLSIGHHSCNSPCFEEIHDNAKVAAAITVASRAAIVNIVLIPDRVVVVNRGRETVSDDYRHCNSGEDKGSSSEG